MQVSDHLRVASRGDNASATQRSPGWRSWFGTWRGPVAIGGLALVLAAHAINQNWMAFATLLPLLYVLPCAAMMYVCMRGKKD